MEINQNDDAPRTLWKYLPHLSIHGPDPQVLVAHYQLHRLQSHLPFHIIMPNFQQLGLRVRYPIIHMRRLQLLSPIIINYLRCSTHLFISLFLIIIPLIPPHLLLLINHQIRYSTLIHILEILCCHLHHCHQVPNSFCHL